MSDFEKWWSERHANDENEAAKKLARRAWQAARSVDDGEALEDAAITDFYKDNRRSGYPPAAKVPDEVIQAAKAIKAAYEEGFDDGIQMHRSDFDQCWLDSQAKIAHDALLSATPQPEAGAGRCSWWREPEEMDGNDWVSDCGANFSFIDEGPVANGFQHCPKCGRKLSQLSPQENTHD